MLLLDIAQLLRSGIPYELCASCFKKPISKSGDERERKRGDEMERNGTERNGREMTRGGNSNKRNV